VPKLRGHAESLGKCGREPVEAVAVRDQRGRKLEQHDAEARSETANRLQEIAEPFRRDAEAAPVREALVRLDAEDEPLRRRGAPGGNGRFARDASERVVDLNRSETPGVVLEHPTGGELLGIERTPPLRVGEPGRSEI
jgi:hypothetical protein